MTTEVENQAGWAKPEGATPVIPEESPKAEAKVEVPPVVPKTYTEAEYKGLQKTLNRLQADLKQAQAVGASLNEVKELREEIKAIKGGIELIIANSGKVEGSEGYEPLAPQYARLTESQKQVQAQVAMARRQSDEAMADIREMVEDAGLEMDASELKEVWKAETPRGAVAAARRITKKIESDKQAEAIKKVLEDERKKIRQELNLDSVDTSTSVGKRGGKKPSLEEMRKTPAIEVKKKFDSGEWSDK